MTAVHADVGEVLIDEDLLRNRIVELGAEISADYEGRDLLLVGVLKGAIFFISDLMRELTVPPRTCQRHVESGPPETRHVTSPPGGTSSWRRMCRFYACAKVVDSTQPL